MAIRGFNTAVEVQKTLVAAVTVTAVTKANPGVVTATAHGLTDGDVVVLSASGMNQLNGRAVRVANSDTNTFELEGIDTSNYGTFASGDLQQVSAWASFDTLTSVSLPNSEPAKLAATTLHSSSIEEIFGLPGSVSGSMSGQFAPLEEAVALMRTATEAGTTLAFRMTFETGLVAVFNAEVSAGQGFDLNVNAIGTANYAMTIKKAVSYFAS